MNSNLKEQVAAVVAATVGGEYKNKPIPDDMRLVGNLLDSMAVNNLIAALEEHFGIAFDDEDLSAESFETVVSITELIGKKV